MSVFNSGKIDELKYKIKNLQEELDYYKKVCEHHCKIIDKMTAKDRCEGKYCQHCEHCGPERVVTSYGFTVYKERTCLLDVPCPDFKRKED